MRAVRLCPKGVASVTVNGLPQHDTRRAIDLDLDRWPIVITTPPPGTVSDQELHDYLDYYEGLIRARSGPYVEVLDLRYASGISPRQRQMLSQRMNEAQSTFAAERLKGTAMVFTSTFMRSLLTTIFWLRKSKHPSVVFANVDQAIAWAEQILGLDAGSRQHVRHNSGFRLR